jgi:TolB protein
MSIPPVWPGTYEVFLWNTSGLWVELTDDSGNNTQPDCNEAMTRIVFRSDRDGNEEIYRMNFDGTGQFNLTKNAARDWAPKWCPGH